MSAAGSDTIGRRDRSGPAPLSFPQERLFLLDRIMPGVPAYNVPRLVRVATSLDEAVLQRALNAVVERHEILRTSIRLEDGVPVPDVSAAGHVELTVVDRHAGTPKPEVDEILAGIACSPFDLSRDVLLRAALVHVAEDEDLLLVVNHHIGSDHGSGQVLFAELDELYRAFRDGREPELPALPIQYEDFAAWQRERVTGELLAELVAYWQEQLAGAPERLELPSDRPRPASQSYRGALYDFTFGPELAASLRALARDQKASLFMVLVAAFKTLLHRYTGADDVVIGAPISGRHHEEIQPLVGFFSNTLVLRTDLSGDPTFGELVGRVKATTLSAQAYQELPFEKLVEVLNPERTTSYSPLFQVLLGFDVAPSAEPMLAGSPIEELPVPGWCFSRLDFSLIVRERTDGSVGGSIEYATALFDRETIARLVDHLRTVLEAAAADPGQRLSELPLLTEAERRQLLEEWNTTSREYLHECLHDQFAAQAKRRPDAVAVACGDEELTFGELDRYSNQLARELVTRGAGRQSVVGICLERSIDLVAAMLAVLKTGAAYVPVDPSYPSERRAFILSDAEVPVVVTHERLADDLDVPGAGLLCLDRDRSRIDSRSELPLDQDADPEQLAYVIYTSGSTGKPKGVEVTHRSVANLLTHMREAPGVDENDVVANLTTPAFDLSVPDWYLPLTTGAKLFIVSREATRDAVQLGKELLAGGATVVQATPTTWQLLVDSDWPGSPGLKIVVGGEALPRQLADELQSLGAVWHAYGPTETTVWSSLHELRGSSEGPAPIGGPIANTAFYLLDEQLLPVPVGVPGELYIGGEGLARGYHRREELTVERFVPDPFSANAGARLYRTGDLLRWRADGTLDFLGRIDQQVKLRGFRIELGEVEAVLAEHPAVATAVAVVREDVPGDRRLVAYVVPERVEGTRADELRRHVAAKLPHFMVPSDVVLLESLPVSANGKIDRTGLPAPDGARRRVDETYAPPRGPVEEALASIWCEILGIDRIGINDDFFDLGGHSLLAIKLLARVQSEFDVELPLGNVFAGPTIGQLGEAVTLALVGDAADEDLAALLLEVEAVE
jgi:amino acid adenylation domain-containing protein